MTHTNQFMLLFRFEPSTTYQPTEAELIESKQEWGKFFGKIAMQEKLVSTHQLGFEGTLISPNKSTTNGMYVSENKIIGGNLILNANSMEEAVEIAKDCPILNMGGTIEVRSITPM